MSIIWILLLGFATAMMTRAFWPRHAPGGAVAAVLLGLAGALTAGLLARGAGLANVATGLPGTLASILGAIAILYGYSAVRSRFGHHRVEI